MKKMVNTLKARQDKIGGILMNVLFICFLLLLIVLLTFVLICCIAVGNDPLERLISDREQTEYIRKWKERHPETSGKKKD